MSCECIATFTSTPRLSETTFYLDWPAPQARAGTKRTRADPEFCESSHIVDMDFGWGGEVFMITGTGLLRAAPVQAGFSRRMAQRVSGDVGGLTCVAAGRAADVASWRADGKPDVRLVYMASAFGLVYEVDVATSSVRVIADASLGALTSMVFVNCATVYVCSPESNAVFAINPQAPGSGARPVADGSALRGPTTLALTRTGQLLVGEVHRTRTRIQTMDCMGRMSTIYSDCPPEQKYVFSEDAWGGSIAVNSQDMIIFMSFDGASVRTVCPCGHCTTLYTLNPSIAKCVGVDGSNGLAMLHALNCGVVSILDCSVAGA